MTPPHIWESVLVHSAILFTPTGDKALSRENPPDSRTVSAGSLLGRSCTQNGSRIRVASPMRVCSLCGRLDAGGRRPLDNSSTLAARRLDALLADRAAHGGDEPQLGVDGVEVAHKRAACASGRCRAAGPNYASWVAPLSRRRRVYLRFSGALQLHPPRGQVIYVADDPCTWRCPEVTRSPTRTRATPRGRRRWAAIWGTEGLVTHRLTIWPRTSSGRHRRRRADSRVSMVASEGRSMLLSVRPPVTM
jgi:hypothetical protein